MALGGAAAAALWNCGESAPSPLSSRPAIRIRWDAGRFISVGAVRVEHDPDRPRHQLEVETEAPVVDVKEIELERLFEVVVGAAAHLPDARQPRFRREPPNDVRPMHDILEFRRQPRTRADDAHVALDHVDQLRKLVKTRRAQEAPDPGDTWVAARL